jgi:hypothetical protein
MVHLIVKERRFLTFDCKSCLSVAAVINRTKCDICRKHIQTIFKCPYCNRIAHYNGTSRLCICDSCNTIFPDLEGIKISVQARIDYHLDKELR